MSSADSKCPVCNNHLDEVEHNNAVKKLEKSVLQRYNDQLKMNKRRNATMVDKLKQVQRRQMQVIAKRYENEKRSLQKKMIEQAKEVKESQKRELVQLKRNYQLQLAEIRDFYSVQNATLQNELKASFAAQLQGMQKNYVDLAADNQRQLETLQKYLEDHLLGELKEKVSRLEQGKMSAEMRLSEMVQQLDQRNAEVVSLKEKLNRIDEVAPEEHAREEVQAELQEAVNGQQDLLRMVREVAEQRELEEFKGELEDNPEDEEKRNFWGSKPGKRFGLF